MKKIIIILIIFVFILFFIYILNQKIVLNKGVSEQVKEICKQKEKIKCNLNCLDGFNEFCYFDSRKYKEEEIERKFSCTESGKQACIGIHSFSQCKKCYNRFELKKQDKFKEVSCIEFFHILEQENKSCGYCIKETWAGCC